MAETPSNLILNQQDAARAIGRSTRWLSSKSAPRLPKSEGGGYELPKLVAWFVDLETASELRDEKTRQEIKVLEQRNRKLELENAANAGNLVDVNELFEDAARLAGFIRSAGDVLARKQTLTGSEAQEIVNNAVLEYSQAAEEFRSRHASHI